MKLEQNQIVVFSLTGFHNVEYTGNQFEGYVKIWNVKIFVDFKF